ncbi:MAG: methyltransferase domain-containing protein [Rhodospirillaceae bacterium]
MSSQPNTSDDDLQQLAEQLSTPDCRITPSAIARARDGQGRYFEPLMHVPPLRFATDMLDPRRALDQASVLSAYTPLAGKKILEIGSGGGVTHIVWSKALGVDGWGIEPEGEGFGDTASIARDLIRANGLDTSRIINATGEALPFPDSSFDVVYSTNVLEHTNDPAQVLREAVRVLKPGGTLQIVCPNYLSYFDGHYAAFHPPIFSNAFFRWWIKWVWRRDPTFAGTIRTEINPVWVRKQLKLIGKAVPISIHTLGQDKFRERMKTADVPGMRGLSVIARLVGAARRLGLSAAAAEIMILAQGWTPLIITVRRERA